MNNTYINKRVLTGFQPTGSGELHIGNYCGVLYDLKLALRNKNIKEENIYIFIADLHGMTTLNKNLREKSININIYIQSDLRGICEGFWLLSMFATSGEMNRMTQFKDKKDVATSNIGLYTYPILMAADILFVDGELIPVGEDQKQHLEEVRNIANRFNSYMPNTFIVPELFNSRQFRIMSLHDVTKKMSKSFPEGCLFLSDKEEEIRKKISKAQTDQELFPATLENMYTRPAAHNLVLIYSIFSDISLEEVINKYKNYKWKDFKDALADILVLFCQEFEKKYNAVNEKEMLQSLKLTNEKVSNIIENKRQKAYGFFL
jgi:tryptophanyl-tRNA synthetase